MGAVFAYVVGSPTQVHSAGFEGVVEFAEIKVNVKTLDGTGYTIVAENVDTVDNLKSKMSDKTGVAQEAFALYMNGQQEELQGDTSLDDAGIDSSSRVFMAKRMDCPRGPGAGGGSRAVASRRVSKERNQVSKDCRDVASFSRHSSDPMTWHLNLKGPAGSPYDGGNFPVTVSFPSSYPLKPPSLTFDTPVYHLNVESDGHVCFPYVSREGYRPRASVCSILQAVSAVLESPDLENAARPDLAVLFKENKAEYLENAKASVES